MYLFVSVPFMGDSFVLFHVSMEIHYIKFTLGEHFAEIIFSVLFS